MTVAYVKNANGSGATVQNTFMDDAGTLHTLLSDNYTDDAGAQHQVFFEYLPLDPLEGNTNIFKATDITVFIPAAEERFFKA